VVFSFFLWNREKQGERLTVLDQVKTGIENQLRGHHFPRMVVGDDQIVGLGLIDLDIVLSVGKKQKKKEITGF